MRQRLKVPIFDIDQNLTTKEIPVVLQKWNIVEEFISTDWRKKLEEGYNWVDNDIEKSFVYGRDTWKDGEDTFPRYIQDVLDEKAFWPSFLRFKHTVLHAHPFWENTSRGHAVNNIVRWTKLLILWSFTNIELEATHEAINKIWWSTKSALHEALDEYLWQQIYAPTHNPIFMETHNIHPSTPYSEKKALIMDHIIKHVSDMYQKLFSKTHRWISIWFSDDDEHNIKAVTDWGLQYRDRLHFQNIHVAIYHTSKTSTIKRRITDKNKMNTLV